MHGNTLQLTLKSVSPECHRNIWGGGTHEQNSQDSEMSGMKGQGTFLEVGHWGCNWYVYLPPAPVGIMDEGGREGRRERRKEQRKMEEKEGVKEGGWKGGSEEGRKVATWILTVFPRKGQLEKSIQPHIFITLLPSTAGR